MGIEIERKFLVTGDEWRQHGPGVRYCQGYLCADARRAVRVRLAGDAAYLTIKGAAEGLARPEFEYPIPPDDARALLSLCEGAAIAKTRYRVPWGDRLWEVDEFEGENAGLIVAEVELESADAAIALPPWVGREVSDDPRYLNASLMRYPFSQWGRESP